MTPKHSVSVAGIVVRDDGRVLAIRRRDNHQWQVPGGVLELEEGFEAGVRREVLEETGVTVSVEHLTGVYKNMVQGVVALVYRCRPVAGSPVATAEATEVKWMTKDEVCAAMRPAFAVRVLDAFDHGVHSRAHDGTVLMVGTDLGPCLPQ